MSRARLSLFAVLAVACSPTASLDHQYRCTSNSDCPNGDSCDLSTDTCVSPEMDAGPVEDAGPAADAGPQDAGPTDAGPQDGGPADAGPVVDAGPCGSFPDGGATFKLVGSTVFSGDGCALCHASGTPTDAGVDGAKCSDDEGCLTLELPTAYGQLVNQPVQSMVWAQANTGLTMRVVPGNPEESALSAAVHHRAALPSVLDMPQGGNPIPQHDIDLIDCWILQGAQND